MDRTVSALTRRGAALALSAILAVGALGSPTAFAYAAEDGIADAPASNTPVPDAPAPDAPAADAPAADGDVPADGVADGFAPVDNAPAKPAPKVATKVTGLNRTISKKPSGTIKDTIKVSPAGKRTVQLQLYSSTAKKWKTRATFTTNSAGKVTLKYPADWKKKNTTKWRVVVKATDTAKKCVSKTVQVTTYNRSTVKLKAKSAIIMEAATGQVFYAKAPDTKRQNASTTKMMTALLTLERNKLSTPVAITKQAATTDYSNLGTKAIGDVTTVKNLLYMTLLPSDNGAAEALAIHTAGSEKAFVALMNARAKELGCTHTSFKNPHGLTQKGHGSSARDLAKIAQAALKNRTFAKIVNTKSYRFTTNRGNSYTVKTTNKLLGKTAGIRGVKTGYTDAAGHCFVGAFKYKGKTYLTVVLGSPSSDQRWSDTRALVKYVKKYF